MLRIMLIISPHFDDAVLSCGLWLETHPGATVSTVCSGRPGPGVAASPEWDALAGFTWADEAMEARQAEDAAALQVLGASQHLLGFLDDLYRPAGDSMSNLEHAIGDLLDKLRPERCLLPLGLGKPGGDHDITRIAALRALAVRPWCAALLYADLPYAETDRDLMQSHIASTLGELSLGKVHFQWPLTDDTKRKAVGCYVSQARLLDLAHPGWRAHIGLGSEQIWHILPPPEADKTGG
jgi:LmbE family N-acetylglucosaminyl deacetylase